MERELKLTTAFQTLHFEANTIRIVMVDGEPHWIAADVCRVLELDNNRQAIARLDEDEKGVISTDTPGGAQTLGTVTEAGLYSLILGSRKPQAKAFKRWVTHEVLPEIRATGHYHKRPETAIEWAHAFIGAETERLQLKAEALENAPKIADWEALMATNNAQKIGTVAKILGYGPNKFFRQLRADKILTMENLPFSDYAHFFEVVTTVIPTGASKSVTLVKPEGMSFLARRYAKQMQLVV